MTTKNATILDVLKGLSQVAANNRDDNKDIYGDGPTKIGLQREEEVSIHDPRVMDGFSMKITADRLQITYNVRERMKNVAAKDFEKKMSAIIEDIASYIRKEYKKVSGKSLSLTREGDCKIVAQTMSSIKTHIQATCVYKVAELKELVNAFEDQLRQERLKKAQKMLKVE
jgi:hypothetical protein